MHNRAHPSGFTLIEILIALSTIAALAVVALPLYVSLQTRNDLDVAATEVVSSERRAQTLAQAGSGDTSWGVSIQAGTIVLFQGTSYASRTVASDEIFTMPSTITPSGLTEIVFTKFTGTPASVGTTTLTSVGGVRNIGINAVGTINY